MRPRPVGSLALALALAACHGGGGADPVTGPTAGGGTAPHHHEKAKPLWSFDPQSYFSDHDFLEGSAFSPELAVVANIPWMSSGGSVGVVGLDVKTGAELWRKDQVGWLVHPPHKTEPLYFVPNEKLGEYTNGFVHLQRLDPKTGAVVSTVELDRKADFDYSVRIVWSAQGLLVIANDDLAAFDWSSGKPRWHAKIPDNSYLFAPVVVGDRIYLPNTTNRIISLVDGKELAAIPGECCTAMASPDGSRVFVRAAVNATDELRGTQVARRITGEVRAVSDAYYAIDTAEAARGTPPVVRVYAHDAADPVVVLSPVDADDFYSAVALSGHTLVYFHKADATLYQMDLRTKQAEKIDEVGSHLVVSTEVVGSSSPFIGTPPIIERPYLFTEEWGVHGYLIGDE